MSETQVALVDSIWRSLTLSVALSLVGVLLYTQSLSMVLLCLLSMACSMVCLLGVCFLAMRWTLGLVEAVGLMVAIGLMVDYNVHLTYCFAREGDATKALHTISFAILCAALTSVGGCIPLLFAEMVPFVQFGIIILLSVTFAFAYVFCLVTPLLFAGGKTVLQCELRVKQALCGRCLTTRQSPPSPPQVVG
ncbi:hypothetical protein BASA81_012481 [Batrachochytrium salamandrivorans]|nr:hypothetical protein BASA81_012481 [Batrachochytrium salamandrivorans]